MSLAALKRNSEKTDTLINTAMANDAKKSYESEDYWKPFLNKETGTGSAIIRFLPALDGNEIPFVKYYDHAFKSDKNQWYIERSRTTFPNDKDPVSELYFSLVNTKDPVHKTYANKLARRANYVANVFIISDAGHPDNNGKVVRYRFGPAIFKMLQDASSPKFEDQIPINPFNLWTGANFNLRAVRDGGKGSIDWKYGSSFWSPPSALFDGDESKLEKMLSQMKNLKDISDVSHYKSYQALEDRLVKVVGESVFGFQVRKEVQSPSVPIVEYKVPNETGQASHQAAGTPFFSGEITLDSDPDMEFFRQAAMAAKK